MAKHETYIGKDGTTLYGCRKHSPFAIYIYASFAAIECHVLVEIICIFDEDKINLLV